MVVSKWASRSGSREPLALRSQGRGAGFNLRVKGLRDQAQEASGHTGMRVGTHCMLGRQWTPRRTGRSRAKCVDAGRVGKGLAYCAEN